jgi:hypothetical protein
MARPLPVPPRSASRLGRLFTLAILLLAPVAAAAGGDSVLSGRVRVAAGAPATGARIVADDGDRVTDTRSGADGTFRLNLPPGTYAVRVELDGSCPARLDGLRLAPRDEVQLDARLSANCRDGASTAIRAAASPAATFALDAATIARLPLDRDDAVASLLALTPGVARGSAFGAGAHVGTARRLDGLDLSDPLDGRAWTSVVLPAIAGGAVRHGVGADVADGSGAVLDLVTRAGGASLRGTIDVVGSARAWNRDTLDDETLAANPRLADRPRPARSVHVATAVSGPLSSGLGFGLAIEHGDEVSAQARQPLARTPRAHGRVVWSGGPRSAGIVGFVDRRTVTRDVPAAFAADPPDGLENKQTRSTTAARGYWQGPLARGLASASVEILRGQRSTRPTSDVPAHEDDVTGLVSGSFGLTSRGERTRIVAGGALGWRTARAGTHDVRVGVEVERTGIVEEAGFTGGEYFHDLAGRPDTVDVWAGTTRDVTLSRQDVFVRDTWTPFARLAIEAGLRASRRTGGGEGDARYGTTAVQPRAGATLALDTRGRVVARGHVGIFSDPFYGAHVDRTVGGETPIVTLQIRPDGRRVELARTTPIIATVAGNLNHPAVREFGGGLDVALTSRLRASGTVLVRRFAHAVDATYPDARWLPLAREGLEGQPLNIYRWLNRRGGESPVLANVDGLSYLAADGSVLGTASATRDYAAFIGSVRADLPDDRASLVVAVTTASVTGTIDDTHADGLNRSDRFASPTAALGNAEGAAALTPSLELTVFGSVRVPLVPVRVSGIYVRQTGARYTPARIFGAATLNVPFDESGRTLRLEPRGTRELDPIDELTLRLQTTLPIGAGRGLDVYADVQNVLRRATVAAVEPHWPFGTTSGTPLAFETPTEVQRPLRILLGGRWRF